MAPANASQRQLRSSEPNLEMWPARRAGSSTKEAYVNWLWLNIPLMAVFFLAITGIPLWLVFKHPDRGPVLAHQSQAQPDSVAARYAASRVQTAPMKAIRLTVAGGDDELVAPALAQARR
jgi:hypothetical protein